MIKWTLVVAALAVSLCGHTHADDSPPAFPKLSTEYWISIADLMFEEADPKVSWSRDREYLSLGPQKSVIFDRWLGGTWYEVTYGTDPFERTNLNISQLLTLKEAGNGTLTRQLAQIAANKAAAKERAAKQAVWQEARAEKIAATRAAAAARKEAEERAAAEKKQD